MLLYRARGVSAHRVKTNDGANAVRLRQGLFLFGAPLHTSSEDLTPEEAATLGASLLGFAIAQQGAAADYALSVVQQLYNYPDVAKKHFAPRVPE